VSKGQEGRILSLFRADTKPTILALKDGKERFSLES